MFEFRKIDGCVPVRAWACPSCGGTTRPGDPHIRCFKCGVKASRVAKFIQYSALGYWACPDCCGELPDNIIAATHGHSKDVRCVACSKTFREWAKTHPTIDLDRDQMSGEMPEGYPFSSGEECELESND